MSTAEGIRFEILGTPLQVVLVCSETLGCTDTLSDVKWVRHRAQKELTAQAGIYPVSAIQREVAVIQGEKGKLQVNFDFILARF